jgi:hypothetical protein
LKETTSTFVNGGPIPEKIDFEFLGKTQKTSLLASEGKSTYR